MIHAIITLTSSTPDLGGLRGLVAEAALLGLAPETQLLDGGHVHIAGTTGAALETIGNDLQALLTFLERAAGLPDETAITHGADLAIDLPVLGVGRISCGEHVGALPENIIVTVNPSCAACVD